MSSSDTTQPPPGHGISAVGKATLDAALRVGGLFAAVIVVALVFVFINPNFANPNLAVSVLRAMSSVAIMAMGLTLVIVVGEIDLSFGAMYGLAANTLAVVWIAMGVSVYLAIPIAIGVGILIGLFNGFLVTSFKIPSFIVTLGGALLLAELQIGLALLSPGPHVQQIFLGAVTIGAVALDLFLTKLRKSRTA